MDNIETTYTYELTDTGERGKLVTVNGYVLCPKCRKRKLCHVNGCTRIIAAGLWCRRCGEVNITLSEP